MHNIFDTITPSLEEGFKAPHFCIHAYQSLEKNPFTRIRTLLLASIERFSVRQSYAAYQRLSNSDLRRDLALIRRTDTRQLCELNGYTSSEEKDSERLILSLFLALTVAAHLAQQADDGRLRDALDFILPEYQDMIYRLSNMMLLFNHKPAQQILGGYVEIMPGRPMIACHRHPYDDIAGPLPELDIFDHIAPMIMAAIEESITNLLQQCIQSTKHSLEKELYIEMALISEQHLSLVSTLIPQTNALHMMLYCQYTEAFLYDSCAADEKHSMIRQLYLEERNHELSHVKKIAELIAWETGEKPPLPSFPDRLQLNPQKGYVRDTLKNLGITTRRGEYVPVGSIKKGADFFRYQKKICNDQEHLPSHQIIMEIIKKNGMDYRFEIAPHPVELLRDREIDPFDIGR